MSSYEALAASYDGLTYDIPYDDVLRFMQQILNQAGLQPETVVDLACGTGSLSVRLAKAGYRVYGVDLSEDMLTVAMNKAMELEKNIPFFVCQNMCELTLPEQVDWVVCMLDSVNYLTDPADCAEMIRRVAENLKPGGMFIFDFNTPYKLRGLDGQVFLDENEDSYCVWRAEYDEEENICYYGIDLFQYVEEEDLWERSFEEHREYAYTPEQLIGYLEQAGFTDITLYGDGELRAPTETEQRIYITAIKR